MDKDKVLKLAQLARIDMPDAEAESLSHEFESILKYVGEITSAKISVSSDPRGLTSGNRNVLREDTEPHESGIYTDKILENAPAREGDYVKVKKIL